MKHILLLISSLFGTFALAGVCIDDICEGATVATHIGLYGETIAKVTKIASSNQIKVEYLASSYGTKYTHHTFKKAADLSPMIDCSGEAICNGTLVHFRHHGLNHVSKVKEIFKNGRAGFDNWSGFHLLNTFKDLGELSRQVSCIGKVCQGELVKVSSPSCAEARVMEIFENGETHVSCTSSRKPKSLWFSAHKLQKI